ncbi:MarR family winged helix-turn-helix transcriptional regulator [Aestuariivirga sp.]|uniref:MarR family winged helix-turn-helix transcriptional regulator n=1 Tax=Aestuariivirga sp. TaxID=2650926 RepID=UPI0039E30842
MARDDEEDDVSGVDIAHPLERLARLMRTAEHSHGLNPAQWEALRYLARANRFSNAPGSLTRYLGATKGTISQTVMALERKGCISKQQRDGEKRSVALALTDQGRAVLEHDPWARLAAEADDLGGKTRRRFARGVSELLEAELKHGGHPAFGTCVDCRFFREKGRDGDPKGPHLCMQFNAPLAKRETALLCAFHEPRN